jgi:hypothetical protein
LLVCSPSIVEVTGGSAGKIEMTKGRMNSSSMRSSARFWMPFRSANSRIPLRNVASRHSLNVTSVIVDDSNTQAGTAFGLPVPGFSRVCPPAGGVIAVVSTTGGCGGCFNPGGPFISQMRW